MTEHERDRLERLAGARVLRLREVFERRDPLRRAGWALLFSDHAGRCPFLDASYRCSIYSSRPGACERFPVMPVEHCLVWPLNKPEE